MINDYAVKNKALIVPFIGQVLTNRYTRNHSLTSKVATILCNLQNIEQEIAQLGGKICEASVGVIAEKGGVQSITLEIVTQTEVEVYLAGYVRRTDIEAKRAYLGVNRISHSSTPPIRGIVIVELTPHQSLPLVEKIFQIYTRTPIVNHSR